MSKVEKSRKTYTGESKTIRERLVITIGGVRPPRITPAIKTATSDEVEAREVLEDEPIGIGILRRISGSQNVAIHLHSDGTRGQAWPCKEHGRHHELPFWHH